MGCSLMQDSFPCIRMKRWLPFSCWPKCCDPSDLEPRPVSWIPRGERRSACTRTRWWPAARNTPLSEGKCWKNNFKQMKLHITRHRKRYHDTTMQTKTLSNKKPGGKKHALAKIMIDVGRRWKHMSSMHIWIDSIFAKEGSESDAVPLTRGIVIVCHHITHGSRLRLADRIRSFIWSAHEYGQTDSLLTCLLCGERKVLPCTAV